MSTGFRRKGRKTAGPTIPGTKPSPLNGLPVVSTGIGSLDELVGGLNLGTLVLVEEDECSSYSRVMLDLFAAEGVANGHALYIGSAYENPEKIKQHLPAPTDASNTTAAEEKSFGSIAEDTVDSTLQIAWRYQGAKKTSQTVSQMFCHTFDLSQTMSYETLSGISSGEYYAHSEESPSYSSLLRNLSEFVADNGFKCSLSPNKLLRICLYSLGTPLWSDCRDGAVPSLKQFLLSLRGLLRSWSAVCMVTVPTYLYEANEARHLQQLSDTAVELESFVGAKAHNPLYKDYHGLFHVHRLPSLHSLCGIQLDSKDWAFKLKRKKFVIEKLHLPPDLSETVNRSQEDGTQPVRKVTSLCSSGSGNSKLDF